MLNFLLFIFSKFRKFCQNFAEFSPNLTIFFGIFPKCNIFLKSSKGSELPQSFPDVLQFVGQPTPPIIRPFLASSSARPSWPAALRDVEHGDALQLVLPLADEDGEEHLRHDEEEATHEDRDHDSREQRTLHVQRIDFEVPDEPPEECNEARACGLEGFKLDSVLNVKHDSEAT